MEHRGEPSGFWKFSPEDLTDDALPETAQRVADHIEKVRRVRFFIDPSLSDEEIAQRIIKIAERHFNLPAETPAEHDTQASS